MTRDEVGDAHLLNPVNAYLTSDRFDNMNYALLLKDGHLTLPPRVYFENDFTITVLVKLNSIHYFSRILDVGTNLNGKISNNLALCTDLGNSSYISLWIYN